jgi:hypothetical protein
MKQINSASSHRAMMPAPSLPAARRPREDFVKTVKRKAKSAALTWKEFGLTAGYHSHTAPAAKGSYYITPTFEREVFNGYLVSQVYDCDTRYLCGKPGHAGTNKLDEAKTVAQADHDAGRDR